MPTIFFNTAWMNEYRGITEADTPIDGGSWAQKHEVCNFLAVDGRCYGFVSPPGTEINIERIGASNDDPFIDGVTVVWCARSRQGKTVVVGIYKNSRVYRTPQKLPDFQGYKQIGFKLSEYYAECAEEDAVLISHTRRVHFIPRGPSAMGQSLIWYANTEIGQNESAKIEKLLAEIDSVKKEVSAASEIFSSGTTTVGSFDDDYREIEEDIQEVLFSDVPDSIKLSLIKARVGQGKFRNQVMMMWRNACAVTGCAIPKILRASHIKPWRDCQNHKERLSPDNGLMLTANLDALFDRGLISFDSKGMMLIAHEISDVDAVNLGLQNAKLLIKPNERQCSFLQYHRESFGFA